MSKATGSVPFPGFGRPSGKRGSAPQRSAKSGSGGRGGNFRFKPGRGGGPEGEKCVLVCADGSGAFGDDPDYITAFRSGNTIRLPRAEELSPLPKEASLQFLPGRHPLAWPKRAACRPENLTVCGDALVLAAQLPSGWTRTLLPAWQADGGAEILPIFGYTAVFYRGGRLWCAAVRTENNPRWRPSAYALPQLGECIARVKKDLPGNRLLEQLEICACQYGCYNAQNIFYGRWEGACPVSPQCNAGCIGCISLQPDKEAPPSPQIRLSFVPTAEEICQLGLYHIGRAERAIFTFGQGCEGEPLLQAPRIAEAIAAIRSKTDKGTLHMNSNGSRPEGAEPVFKAGLNSIRVSMCSAVESTYNAYYRPRNYKFADVLQTIKRAREHGLWISINLLLIPGLNDRRGEAEALAAMINEYGVNMVQLRNLNIDPDWLFAQIGDPGEASMGVPALIAYLKENCPHLRVGCHNPSREEMDLK